jgi:hypothetical protein
MAARLQALRLYAGPAALRHLHTQGLQARDVGIVAGAAGGPKGLILGPLDRFIFGHWLAQSAQPIDLVGASIGAWRMATACLDDCAAAFERFEHGYIRQQFELPAGRKRPTAAHVSERFAHNLQLFYAGRAQQVLAHRRYRLHVLTARGRHLLRREGRWRTPAGYLGAWLSNALHRPALGAWLERVVFSTPGAALPFGCTDLRTQQVWLDERNWLPALQASCSVPFAMQAVPDIAGAPPGAYWDGGITDYHLHLDWQRAPGLVLYPHFQRQLVPGWLDKALKWRHRSTAFLDRTLVLAPDPAWLRTLPDGKLPDRSDFERYGSDLAARMRAWSAAAAASQQLADEFAAWLQRPDPSVVQSL